MLKKGKSYFKKIVLNVKTWNFKEKVNNHIKHIFITLEILKIRSQDMYFNRVSIGLSRAKNNFK